MVGVAAMTEVRRQATFLPGLDSASQARRETQAALGGWDLQAAEEPALAIVTELISNAVRHAQTPHTLALSYDGSRLRIEVEDQDPRPPALAPLASIRTHGGWGLRLVSTLSSDWGVQETARGKTVWAELEPPGVP